jgi:predicted nuclease of predicted toxin-antitoxin system
MAINSFYFDEMMPRAAAEQLAQRGLQIVMAVDVEMIEKEDVEHLKFATEHSMVMVTFDRPFAGRTAELTDHGGLICLSGQQNDIGSIVRSLRQSAEQYAPHEVAGRVFWI